MTELKHWRWSDEFPDFPAADLPAIPDGWTDVSWRNDVCPSFEVAPNTRLFIDWADKEQRELSEGSRFTMIHEDLDADITETLLQTDDWQAVLDKVEQITIPAKWVARLGLGFHPDTRGADYRPALTDAEIAEYDRDMETLFAMNGDPYERGIAAMTAWREKMAATDGLRRFRKP